MSSDQRIAETPRPTRRLEEERSLSKTFDPHALDWSRHRLWPEHREFGPGMLLADVTPLIGVALLEGWSGRETDDIVRIERPALEIPSPYKAFDRDGAPIPEVHDAFAAIVREAARWTFEPAPSASEPGRETGKQTWSRPDGRPGEPLEGHAVTMEMWNDANVNVFLAGFRTWARTSLEHVAAAIADMAMAGSIRLLARPLPGGEATALAPSLWHTGPEMRMRRLAASGLSLAAPFDPDAAVDHLLFVDEDGLVDAIEAYAEKHFVPELHGDHPWFDEASVRRSITPQLDEKLRQELRRVLVLPENRYWRVPQAQDHIARHPDPGFGLGLEHLVARACNDLKAEGAINGVRYASLGESGRPRIGLELVRARRATTSPRSRTAAIGSGDA